jgi:hypothetical protein
VYAVPLQTPLVHTSVLVHALPSLQVVPLVTLDHALVETAGWQLWQALPGFAVPDA